jgi:hypothetical protein
VNEHIRAAAIRRDEAEAPLAIEEFHDAIDGFARLARAIAEITPGRAIAKATAAAAAEITPGRAIAKAAAAAAAAEITPGRAIAKAAAAAAAAEITPGRTVAEAAAAAAEITPGRTVAKAAAATAAAAEITPGGTIAKAAAAAAAAAEITPGRAIAKAAAATAGAAALGAGSTRPAVGRPEAAVAARRRAEFGRGVKGGTCAAFPLVFVAILAVAEVFWIVVVETHYLSLLPGACADKRGGEEALCDPGKVKVRAHAKVCRRNPIAASPLSRKGGSCASRTPHHSPQRRATRP